jgi:uncharacterized membrane protein YoaK (UPF0700 family)
MSARSNGSMVSGAGPRFTQAVRRIASSERTETGNAHLGMVLTFVAGAVNAGGFLSIGQYTSHMSGIVSGMADNLAIGAFGLAVIGLGALLPFVAGSACSAILINWGRRHGWGGQYALPLLLEALLLCAFGALGGLAGDPSRFALTAIPLLCFIMGLQNATVTKISGARIRTTHITGIVTDFGIEFGKLLYRNSGRLGPEAPVVRADRGKLMLLAGLLTSFFGGGVLGALGFKYLGFVTCVPLAYLLLILAAPPILDDVRARLRPRRS